MKKHKVEKFLSSLFGHHIHHEHSQVLEGKKGIEKKMERILELIGAQENSGNLKDEAEIVPFIEEFYENYKLLYGKYHHLVEKIKEHPNKELNGDLSSSSDSDSSDSESEKSNHGKKSSKHNGREHGKHKVSMDEYLELQGELEIWKNRSQELEMQSDSLLSRLRENERMLIETRKFFLALENGSQSMKHRSGALKVEDEKSNLQLETSGQQQFDVNQKLTDVSKEYESLISKMALAQASFDEVKAERDSLNDAIKKLQNENMVLKEQLTAASHLEVENETLKLQLETSSQQLIDLNQKLTAVSQEYDSLVSQMALAQASVDEVKAERDSLNDALKELQNENMVLKEETTAARDQVEDLNNKLVTASEEIDKLVSEHASVLSMINKAEKTIEDLKLEANMNLTTANEKASEISDLRGIIEGLNLKLEIGSQQLTDLSQQLATLKEENSTLNFKVQTASIQLQEFQTITDKFKTECELLKDSEFKLLGINEELMQEKRMKTEEFDALASTHNEVVDKIKLAEEQIEKLLLDLNHVSEEKSEISKSHEGLKEDLQASFLKLSELENKLEGMSAEKHALHREYEVLASEKSVTMSRLNDALKAVEELTANRDLFKNELDILQQDITAEREELRIEAEKVTDLQGQLALSDEEKTKAVSKLINVEKLSEDLRSERDSLNDVIKQLQNENMILKEEIKVASNQVEDLNKGLVIANEEKDRLDAEHLSVLSMIDKAEKTIEDLKLEAKLNLTMANEKAFEISDLCSTIEQLNVKLETGSQQVTDLCQQLATLKEENHTLYSEVQMCNTQLQEFQTTIDKLKTECELLKDSELKLVGINEELVQEKKIKNEEFDALSSKHSEVVDKIKLAEENIEKLLLDLNHVNDEKSELSKSHEDLKQELQASAFKVSELENKLEAILAEKDALNGEYEVLASERSVTLNRLNDTLKMVEELTAQRDLFKNELDKLQLDITAVREKLTTEAEKVTNLYGQIAYSDEEKTKALSKLDDVEKQNEDLRSERDSLNDMIEQLQNEHLVLKKEMKATCDQMEDLNKKLVAANGEKDRLEADHSSVLSMIDKAEKTIEDLKLEAELNLTMTNEKALEISDLRSTIEQLNLKLEMGSQQVMDLSQQLVTLKEENCTLNAEVHTSNTQLQELQTTFEGLKMECQLLKDSELKYVGINEDLMQEKRMKTEEFDALSSKHSEVVNKIKLAEEHIEKLLLDINIMTRDKSELSKSHEGTKQELQTATLKVSELENKLEGILAEKHALSGEYEALASERSVSMNMLNDTGKMVEELTIERNLFKDEVDKLQQDITAMREELRIEVEKVTDLHTQLANSDDEKTKVLRKLFDAEKWGEDLRSEKESLDGKIVTLHYEIVSLKQEMEQKLNQASDLQSQLTSTNEEKTLLFSKLSEIEKENEELKIGKQLLNDQILKLQEDSATLLQSLESEKGMVADLDLKLTYLTQENEALCLGNAAAAKKLEDTEKTIIDLKNDLSINVNMNNDKQSENDDLLAENKGLKSELEAVNQQRNDLSHELATAKEECSTLRFGIAAVESEMQDTKKSIEQIRSDYNCLKNEESRLLKTIEELKIDLRAKDDEIDSLSSKISEFVEENKLAKKQIETMVTEIQKLNDENSKLSTELEMLKVDFNLSSCKLSELEHLLKVTQEEKNEIFQKHAAHLERTALAEKLIEDLKSETEHHRYLNSESEVKITDLRKSLSDKEKEKDLLVAENLSLLEKLQQGEDVIKKAEMEVGSLKEEVSRCQQVENDLLEKNSTLQRTLDEKENALAALRNELDNMQKETSSQITTMITRSNDLQLELDILHNHKCEMEEQRKNLINEISENKILMDNVKSELMEKLSIQESALNEQTSKFEQLRESHELLEGRLHETCLELETALAMLKELDAKNEKIGRLETLGQELKTEKEQLEEKHRELSDNLRVTDDEKINAEKEIIRLQGQVDTLEVQLRLSNRKLKITETEQREKGTNYERRIEELLENQKKLEAAVTNFQEERQLLETMFEKIKDATEEELANLGLSSQSLASLIIKTCNNFQARVSECSVQLQKMKGRLEDIVSKKQELDHERSELRVRVKYKEGICSMLKEEADSLQLKLAEKTKEEERLTGVVIKYEKKITELENLLRAKEEAASYKDEEKREAIRQLCILIEYHRENYTHLYQILSSKFARPRS